MKKGNNVSKRNGYVDDFLFTYNSRVIYTGKLFTPYTNQSAIVVRRNHLRGKKYYFVKFDCGKEMEFPESLLIADPQQQVNVNEEALTVEDNQAIL